MAKKHAPSRTLISAQSLEFVARCTRSINYLGRIQANSECRQCKALAVAAMYVLQRSFRGSSFPTVGRLTDLFAKELGASGKEKWAIQLAEQQYQTLDHLRDWGRGVWEKIDTVNVEAETHFGLFTIHQLIHSVMCIDDWYTVVRFTCDSSHPDQFLNYVTLHASYWLREAYGVDRNKVMVVRLTPTGPEFNLQEMGLKTEILRQAIETILSAVSARDVRTADEQEAALAILPPNPGPHCYSCLGCFETETTT